MEISFILANKWGEQGDFVEYQILFSERTNNKISKQNTMFMQFLCNFLNTQI